MARRPRVLPLLYWAPSGSFQKTHLKSEASDEVVATLMLASRRLWGPAGEGLLGSELSVHPARATSGHSVAVAHHCPLCSSVSCLHRDSV